MYKISLEKEDFLRYQLYTASQSKSIRKKRIRTWILLTISFFILGLVLLQNSDKFLSFYFIGFSLLTFILFPFYQRRQYKIHYEKHINENYRNRFGIESEIRFEDGFLISKTDAQEGKIKLTEIQEINEITGNLFIKIKTGESIIIPSRYGEFNKLKEELVYLISPLGVEWKKQLNWKWK
jgi:hypothetical protein